MITDYRALCAELYQCLEYIDRTCDVPIPATLLDRVRAALAQPEPVALTRPDCFEFAMDFLGGKEEVEVRNYIERLESAARATLAQPEPEPPRPLKERPDFISGYREGLADRKRITEHEEAERRPIIQPVPVAPTDEALLRLAAHIFGYTFKDGGIGGGESEFLAFARAVYDLARWGAPAIQPVPVSERLPGPEDCDEQGRCWILMPDIGTDPSWRLTDPRDIGPYHTHWLPHHALPTPEATNA
jgi:hypothetical protein